MRSFLMYVFAIILLTSSSFLVTKEVLAFNPITKPEQGDYLRYNVTRYDMFGIAHSTTFNLTFFRPPFNVTISGEKLEVNGTAFPDLIKAVVEVGDWAALEVPEPEEEVWMLVNVTDRTIVGSYPFNYTPPGSIPYFEYIIPTDVYVGAEILFIGYGFHKGTVIKPDHLSKGGEQYPVWIVTSQYSYNYKCLHKFEASKGILLWKNITSIEDENIMGTFDLIEAKIGTLVVVPEFFSISVLPIFMIATLLAVIIYKRKHSV